MKNQIILFILIIFCLIVFSILIRQKNLNKRVQILELEKTDAIDIPLFPSIKNVHHFRPKNNGYREVWFEAKLHYPSKKIFDFYKRELKKEKYEKHIPKSHPYKKKIGDWKLSYSNPGAINPYHAQLDAFWINKKTGRIIWLLLFYQWNTDNSPITLEKNNKQHGIIYISILDKNEDLINIDIYKYFSEKISGKVENKKLDFKKRLNNIDGFYIIKDEKFEFKEMIKYSRNKIGNPEVKELFDLYGNKHLIFRKSIFNEKDIDKIFIQKKDAFRNVSKEEINRLGIFREHLSDIYDMFFFIKKDSQKKVKSFLEKMKDRYLGIVKYNKLISNIFVSGGLENNGLLIVRGIDIKQVKFFIRGMTRKE